MVSQPTLLLAHTVSRNRTESLLPELESSLPDGVVRNAVTPNGTRELLPETDVLVTGSFDDAWLDDAETLQLVQALWAGVDSYPLGRIEANGITLANAAGVHAEPIAQQVMGYLLQFERGFVETARNQHRGVWERVDGGELGDDTLGIIGVGAIGSRVAELAQAFGMDVVGTKRDLSDRPDGVDELLAADEYRTLLRQSSYVLVSCPLTEETEGLLGIDEFRLMDPDSVLVNVARGEIVDQDALRSALQYRLIRGAALDVFEEEPLPPDSVFWDLSNVVITPHNAWRSPNTADRWLEIIEDNYWTVAEDDPASVVNRVI
jgi:phosphoglycerate dehydrogenase-like enzyme